MFDRVRRGCVIGAILVLPTVQIGCRVPTSDVSSHEPSAQSSADPATARGFILKELGDDKRSMLYAVYVPRAYDASKPWPCIVFLHGRGESGHDGLRQCVQGLGSAIQWNEREWPFIVLFPQKPDASKQWEAYDTEVMKILADAIEDYTIDPDRVYLTGLSQGGHGTWAFASKHPGTFAAIAPICGYIPPLSLDRVVAGVGNVPIWAFHGLADDVVKPEGTTEVTNAIKAARGSSPSASEVKASLYEGVNHGSWDRAYRTEQLGAWFLKYRRGGAAKP